MILNKNINDVDHNFKRWCRDNGYNFMFNIVKNFRRNGHECIMMRIASIKVGSFFTTFGNSTKDCIKKFKHWRNNNAWWTSV